MTLSQKYVSIIFVVVSANAFICCLSAQSVIWVAGSTEPRLQLTGEHHQIDSNGTYFTAVTPGRTVTNYGVIGTDLGFPVVYSDKILLLFGDTLGAYAETGTAGTRYFLSASSGGDDSIGYIPNVDLDRCHLIKDVDDQLAKGNFNPAVDGSNCPVIRFYTNPGHGQKEHRFKSISISGLRPGDGLGPFMTPSGAVDYNDRLYMFFKTRIQEAEPHLALETIVARSDQSPRTWSDTTPPSFTRLYTVSSHSPVPDLANPPPETTGTGKFMFDPPVVMDSSTIANHGLAAGLPASLRSTPKVVFLFGSSWRYNRSDLYLAAFALPDIEVGPSKWFYYAGKNDGINVWSFDETKAAPLLGDTPNIGNHTVMWNGALRRFILMYGNIVARSSATPWGPWSEPVNVFPPGSDWARKLIHHPSLDRITRTVLPIYNANTNRQTDLNSGDRGVPYGPNLIDKYTQNADGSVTLFYTVSTWNPYEVFLVSSRFAIGRLQRPVVSSASYDGAAVSPGSIVSLFAPNLAAGIEAAQSTTLPLSLAGTNVLVQDSQGISRIAPLYFLSPKQVNFVLPSETALGPATISVVNGSRLLYSAVTRVASIVPALFSANANGSGVAAAFMVTAGPDGLRQSRPVFTCGGQPGSCAAHALDIPVSGNEARLELYGTGIRNVAGISAVNAIIGDVSVPVVYAGPQQQYPGMDQVVLSIPAELKGRGQVDLVVLVEGQPTNVLRLAFM